MPPHIVDFRQPESFSEVAQFLGLKVKALREAIAAGAAPSNRPLLYIRHQIPKKNAANGQFRTVWDVADTHLRDTHRAFAWKFADFAKSVVPGFPHPAAYGYVRGQGIKKNAAQHRGAARLLRCDLRDFFPTISKHRLIGRFIQVGIRPAAADVLAAFATIEEKLALGLNASPMLANLVCLDLDLKLDALAKEHGCKYTRYADDIAISGDTLPLVAKVADAIDSEGFSLATSKVRVTKLGQAHYVTGLSISDPNGPHVPRSFKRKLRQELYYCRRFGIRGHLARLDADRSYQKGINRIDGTVRYVASIESRKAEEMRRQWNEMLAGESAKVSYAPVHDRVGADATFLIDETEFERDGKRFLALACVTTQRLDFIRLHAEEHLRQHLVDPYSSRNKKKLKQKGLHFTDATESLRDAYVVLLPLMPFRAYIAFGELRGESSYASLYMRLFSSLMPRRFKGHDRGTVTVRCEVNPRISLSELTQRVDAIYSELETHNERRPIVRPTCDVKGKLEEPAFSLPDALLWIFAQTFSAKVARNIDYLRFERLRDKYRHIVNIDTRELFSRRHPIEVHVSAQTN